MTNAPDLVSVAEAGRLLDRSPRAVLRKIQIGQMAATKLGPGTAGYVIQRSEVERVLAEREAPKAEQAS